MTYYYESELYHHGIKGQKWGVRRFQNEDGSLTAEGERRYSDDQRKAIEKRQNKVREHDAIKDGIKYTDKKGNEVTLVSKKEVADSRKTRERERDDLMRKFEAKNAKDASKLQKKFDRIQKDIDSFKSIKDGLTVNGRTLLTADDVSKSVSSLVQKQENLFKGRDYLKEYMNTKIKSRSENPGSSAAETRLKNKGTDVHDKPKTSSTARSANSSTKITDAIKDKAYQATLKEFGGSYDNVDDDEYFDLVYREYLDKYSRGN